MEMQKRVYYHEADTPVGSLLIATTTKGICWLSFSEESNSPKSVYQLQRWMQKWLSHDLTECNGSYVQEVIFQLQQYMQGDRKRFEVELDLLGLLGLPSYFVCSSVTAVRANSSHRLL